ncbi:MAG: D-Ala-D-Ala carboxypeptidase [Peptococcaceae bacterium BRH_c4b]|nr:MAG: D-Ala-D-Ala carboxypeptidase [Peptococcaceae bacterium BRH_c4b]
MPGKILLRIALLSIITILALSAPVFAVPPSADKTETGEKAGKKAPLNTTAESAVLMEANSGQIIFEKEPDKELPMASVTKLMTLLLATDAVESGKVKLTDKVTVTENAWHMGGSQIFLEPGEEMTMKEMLIAVAVGSANDASVAVAEHISGSEEAFVEAMNQRARELGLKHTHFANPTGLPAEGHYSSARDLAVVLRECLKSPLFRNISSIYEYDLRGGDFKLWSNNKLLKWYPGVDAGKTGWTNEAKYCLASSCIRDGLRLVAVVLGTPEVKSHYRESIKLYNYGYARYKAVNVADAGIKVKSIPVGKGVERSVNLITAGNVGLVVPKGEEKGFTSRIDVPEQINAPVQKGQEIGNYVVVKNGREVLRVPLVAERSINKASIFTQMNRAFNKFHGLQ